MFSSSKLPNTDKPHCSQSLDQTIDASVLVSFAHFFYSRSAVALSLGPMKGMPLALKKSNSELEWHMGRHVLRPWKIALHPRSTAELILRSDLPEVDILHVRLMPNSKDVWASKRFVRRNHKGVPG